MAGNRIWIGSGAALAMLTLVACVPLKKATTNSYVSRNLVGKWQSNIIGTCTYQDDGSFRSSLGGVGQWSVDYPFIRIVGADGREYTYTILSYNFEGLKSIKLRDTYGVEEILTQTLSASAPAPETNNPKYSQPLKVGVSLEPVNESNRQRLGLSQFQGWYVSKVDSGSPAAEAGILPGDFIIKAEGKKVSSITPGDPFGTAKIGKKTGDYISLTTVRDSDGQLWKYELMVRLK